MTSYDDFISDATGMMYLNKYDFAAQKNGTKLAAFKLWNLNFKAAPKAGVSIAHNKTTQQTWDDKVSKYEGAEKTSTKVGWKHDDVKFDIATTNDKWSLKVATPLVTDDWKVDGSVAVEEKPQKSRKATIEAGIVSPDMGGVVAAVDLSADQEWKHDKEWTVKENKASMNVGLHHAEQEAFLGFSVETDGKALTGSEVMVMKKDEGNKFWAGFNNGDQYAQAGCLINNAEKKFTHAYELRYHMDDKKAPQKFFDQPMSVAGSGKYVLSDKTTMNYSAEFGTWAHAQAKFTHKMDKNWTVAAHQSFNIADVEKKHPYQLGFDVNYTL